MYLNEKMLLEKQKNKIECKNNNNEVKYINFNSIDENLLKNNKSILIQLQHNDRLSFSFLKIFYNLENKNYCAKFSNLDKIYPFNNYNGLKEWILNYKKNLNI